MSKRPSKNKNSPTIATNSTARADTPSPAAKADSSVKVAWIGLAGTITVAIIGLMSALLGKWFDRLPTPTVGVAFTATQALTETLPPAWTLIPTSTPWPLGNQTATDSKPFCAISVSDYQEPGREHAKALEFSITGKGGYCVWVVPLNAYDASSKKGVTFWVKGEKGGEQYYVGIIDGETIPGHETKVLYTASGVWTQVSIPLESFKNQDLSSLENFSLGFNTGSGTIYVDRLIFVP